MDPITHCLVGGLVAKTVKAPPRRLWILMFLGEVPDMDVFFSGLGSWAFWLHHRGITHSLFGVLVQALFFAWLFSKWDKGAFRERLWQYSIPLLLHIYCDYLTSYGVPIFSPFTFREFSGDLVPALTLIPLGFMLAGMIYIFRRNREGWKAVGPLWAAWAAYLFLSMSGKAYARHLVSATEYPVTVVSGLTNPFQWTAVVEDKAPYTYRPYLIDVLKGEKRAGPHMSTPNDGPYIRASLEIPEVKYFLRSNRWPVAREIPTEHGVNVEWGRIIFSSRGFVRGLLQVSMSSDGSVQKVQRIHDFWGPAKLWND